MIALSWSEMLGVVSMFLTRVGLLVMNRSNMAPSRVLFSFICCMLWSASVSRKSSLVALFAAPSCTVHKLQSMSLKLKSSPIITWSLGVVLAVILARSVPNWATSVLASPYGL